MRKGNQTNEMWPKHLALQKQLAQEKNLVIAGSALLKAPHVLSLVAHQLSILTITHVGLKVSTSIDYMMVHFFKRERTRWETDQFIFLEG